MRTVTVAWDPARACFTAEGTARGRVLDIGAPKDAAQAGMGPTGFSAADLLLAGAGACAAWDVVEIMRKGRQQLVDLQVRVEGEQASEAPWEFRRVRLSFTLRGRGLSVPAAERAVELSVERYCAVVATIRGISKVSHEVTVIEQDDVSTS